MFTAVFTESGAKVIVKLVKQEQEMNSSQHFLPLINTLQLGDDGKT